MSLTINVRKMLGEKISEAQNHHLQAHSLCQKTVKNGEEAKCLYCKIKMLPGEKILACFSVLDSDATTETSFCGQKCHDLWVKDENTWRPEIMRWQILPEIARIKESVETFSRLFEALKSHLNEEDKLRETFGLIEFPEIKSVEIIWGDIELRDDEKNLFDDLQREIGEHCGRAIKRNLGIGEEM